MARECDRTCGRASHVRAMCDGLGIALADPAMMGLLPVIYAPHGHGTAAGDGGRISARPGYGACPGERLKTRVAQAIRR